MVLTFYSFTPEHCTFCERKKQIIGNKTYSQFSLFMVVLFYKGSVNTEWANTEPLLLEKYRLRFLWTSGHNIFFSDQYIILFHEYFCLKTPYLIYTADSLALNSWPTGLEIMPKWSLSNTGTFSVGHITAFLSLGTLDSTSALCLGPFWAVKSPTKSTKIWTMWHYIYHEKDTCLQYESWDRKAGVICSTSAGHARVRQLKISPTLCMFIDDCESRVNIDTGVVNKF